MQWLFVLLLALTCVNHECCFDAPMAHHPHTHSSVSQISAIFAEGEFHYYHYFKTEPDADFLTHFPECSSLVLKPEIRNKIKSRHGKSYPQVRGWQRYSKINRELVPY
ncbi:hypothetical protein ANCCAN_18798 [Ancylostoma caninum]|uniref:Uncharacterized protein n=1 Tax=Ancylostoma caninum TaxID=29170 RepID=A0A368FSX9_ANCCA|nr:hypothetical protein ANCCAN_18798 [Ancylostoma caninum]